MRSSDIKSILHRDRLCDIAIDSIVQFYTNTKEVYTSNLYSFITNNKLNIIGNIGSDNHPTDIEITDFIRTHINSDIDIILNIDKQKEYVITSGIKTNTYIGYYCAENELGLPFEHLRCLDLSNYLFEFKQIPFTTSLTINGDVANICIEAETSHHADIIDIINQYFNSKSYDYFNINLTTNSSTLNRSGLTDTSLLYGPRIPYGNINYFGTDINSTDKYAIYLSRMLAKHFLINHELNYCLVELTYHSNNDVPIQIGVKGNPDGIHLENGTFFIPINNKTLYYDFKSKIINSLTFDESALINIAKNGITYSII